MPVRSPWCIFTTENNCLSALYILRLPKPAHNLDAGARLAIVERMSGSGDWITPSAPALNRGTQAGIYFDQFQRVRYAINYERGSAQILDVHSIPEVKSPESL